LSLIPFWEAEFAGEERLVRNLNMRNKLAFTGITLIIGIMLAIQFQSHKEPVVRDTRDTWELRSELLKEQEKQSELLHEINGLDGQLAKYEAKKNQSKEQAIRETIAALKEEAGLTEIKGKGIIITLSPATEGILLGEQAGNISPELLKKLINELNMYDARHISVNGQRIINNTVIRDINGQTKIDGYPLSTYPIEIRIIGMDANKLKNRMQVSEAMDDFFVENFKMKVSEPKQISIPPYLNPIRVKYMEPVNEENGGK
jgi:uncharacterized protein YlxW (UPF0749 family)